MTEKNHNPDPSGFFSLSKDWLATQQKFMPSGRMFAQLAETVRTITQAQIAYSQTVMRAEAALLAAMMELPNPAMDGAESHETRERPSKAVHRPDMQAP